MRSYRSAALGALLVASLATATGCGSSGNGSGGGGGGGNSNSANALDPTTAKAQVTQLYQRFFDEPQAQAEADLQDGATLGKAIQIAAKLKGQSKNASMTAKVKSVSLNTKVKPPTATVNYALIVNGSPSLPNATGYAIYVNGKWMFAKTTFCQLVSLGTGKTPPGCEGA